MKTRSRCRIALLAALPLGGCALLGEDMAGDEPMTCRSSGGPVVRCDHETPPREVRKPGDPHTLPNVAL